MASDTARNLGGTDRHGVRRSSFLDHPRKVKLGPGHPR